MFNSNVLEKMFADLFNNFLLSKLKRKKLALKDLLIFFVVAATFKFLSKIKKENYRLG